MIPTERLSLRLGSDSARRRAAGHRNRRDRHGVTTAWITRLFCCIEELSWQIGKRYCDFKTLESTSGDSLSQNDIKKTVLDYTAGLGACKIGRFCRLPSPRLVGASTDELPLVTRFPWSLAGLNHFKPSQNDFGKLPAVQLFQSFYQLGGSSVS